MVKSSDLIKRLLLCNRMSEVPTCIVDSYRKDDELIPLEVTDYVGDKWQGLRIFDENRPVEKKGKKN